MNVLIISSSLRKDSLSLRFARYLEKEIKFQNSLIETRVVGFENFDIQSAEKFPLTRSNLSNFQNELISNWERADLIFFCIPEYNWTANGEVLLMLEQFGRTQFAHLFDEKIFSMVGISSGRGGRMPALDVGKVLEKLISFLNQIAVVSPKIFEAHEVGLNLNFESDSTGNPVFEKGVRDFLNYTFKFENRWMAGSAKKDLLQLSSHA